MLHRNAAAVILLALCFSGVSADPQAADECTGSFKGVELAQKQIDDLIETGSRYPNIPFPGGMKINLCGANLRGKHAIDANFINGNLRDADLGDADLSNSWFWGADMSGAALHQTRLVGAQFNNAKLRGAKLGTRWVGVNLETDKWSGSGADLSSARFIQADLTDAHLDWVTFDNTVFELLPGALPHVQTIASARGLSKLTFEYSAHSLIELREQFKRSGLREQEREVTCAINRAQISKLESPVQRGFHWLLFDITPNTECLRFAH